MKNHPFVKELSKTRSRKCPSCGSDRYTSISEKTNDIHLANDRICKNCQTRYSPIPSVWLGISSIIFSFIVLGALVMSLYYEYAKPLQAAMTLSWWGIVMFIIFSFILFISGVHILRINREADRQEKLLALERLPINLPKDSQQPSQNPYESPKTS